MKPKNPNLTAERLREVLSYEPETGLFRWLKGGHGVRSGDVAGALGGNGYVQIRIDGRKCYAHRLAWLCVHGVLPEEELDHRNGVRSDNRIANLRGATHAENAQNRIAQRNSTSGIVGVNWHKGRQRWRAEIKIDGVRTHLGWFESIDGAIDARTKAKAEVHAFQPVDRTALARTPAKENDDG